MSAMKTVYELIQEMDNEFTPCLSKKFEDADVYGQFDPSRNEYKFRIEKGNGIIYDSINFLDPDLNLNKEMDRIAGRIKTNLYSQDAFSEYMNPPVEEDVVNHPSHYTSGAHECIDVMEAMFGTPAVISFCKCNIFKYRFRADKKNGEEDIKKAEWYETKLMELREKIEKGDIQF